MADTLNYSAIKNARLTKEYEEQRHATRKKNLLVLIWNYLQEMGYTDASRMLDSEANIDLSQFTVCDNIDLDTIVQDFESYYYVRFQKYPQLVKKCNNNKTGKLSSDDKSIDAKTNWKARYLNKNVPSVSTDKVIHRRRINSCLPTFNSPSTNTGDSKEGGDVSPPKQESLSLSGQQLLGQKRSNENQDKANICEINFPPKINEELHLLKPLGLFSGYNEEWKELAMVISKDIYQHNPNVKWDDIIGLDEAKRLIKEAVVYPIKYPELFTGILSPWKALLLYGPPGTGKTLLAKAVATQCKTTFFNISASSIVSKWRGDSEKLVRVLFELARFHAPSTIFIDELDSLMSQRDSAGINSEHEGSRRMKTELLIQMDGMTRSKDLVFLLAASNLPWELDHAMLRRLEKRILVDLPNEQARQSMFRHILPPTIYTGIGLKLQCKLDYEELSTFANGYSGSDILLVCKEAAMERIRRVLNVLEQDNDSSPLTSLTLDEILNEDVAKALSKTKPSASQFKHKYREWQAEYGSV